MVGSGLQPDFVQYGCPWIFLFCMLLLLYDGSDLGYPHGHAAFPVRHPCLLPMLCVTRLTGSNKHKT